MKEIKRDGVKKRYPYLSEYEVTWYQGGYNDAVEMANKKIEKLRETIAWLQENYKKSEMIIEELQLRSLRSPKDQLDCYFGNENKVIPEP